MMRARILAVLIGFATMQSPAFPQVTPSHVFQVAEAINQDLNDLHKRNFTTPTKVPFDATDRMPRHVLQKAREVYAKAQILRFLNGLQPHELEPFPAREVTPADVKALADLTLTYIRELRPAYGLETTDDLGALPSNKSPVDVYNALEQASRSLDGLGISAITPNEVHQIATTIVTELIAIERAELGDTPPSAPGVEAGHSPAEVYDLSHDLLIDIQRLTERKGWKISGGITIPAKHQGPVNPAQVMSLLNIVLADIGVLKTSVGLNDPVELANIEPGKTPSHVYAKVAHSRLIVERLMSDVQ